MIRKILPQDLHFALDLRKARETDIQVEAKLEKQITCEVVAAPVFGQKARAPSPTCSCP